MITDLDMEASTRLGQANVPPGFADGPGERGLVSVIIPTFNRAYIIGAAIESVLSQTYASLEIIVCDDGSTDNTAEVVARFNSPRIRYLHQANAGVSAARNLGLLAARGEFVALLDSDDSWMPWKIEAQVAVLQALPDVGMVWTDMVATDEHGNVTHQRYLRQFYAAHKKVRIEEVCNKKLALRNVWAGSPRGNAQCPIYVGSIFSQMVLGNLVHTSTTMLRRSRLRDVGLFDTSLLHSGEDYDFHLRTTMLGPVALLDEPAIYYRVGANDQLTGPGFSIDRARNNLATVRRCLDLHAAEIDLPSRLIHARLADALAWTAQTELESGNRSAALGHVWSSLCHRLTLSAVALLAICCMPRPRLWVGLARRIKRRALSLSSPFGLRSSSAQAVKGPAVAASRPEDVSPSDNDGEIHTVYPSFEKL